MFKIEYEAVDIFDLVSMSEAGKLFISTCGCVI